jgi:hypothetical protein
MEDKKYSKLKASFEATQPQMPADFTDRVMKHIEQPVSRRGGLDPTEKRRARWLPVLFIAAAACIALLFYVGGLRNTQLDETPRLVAQTDTAKTVSQTETKKELPIEKGEMTDTVKRVKEILRMPRPPRHYMAKAETVESTPKPDVIDEEELAETAFAEERIRMEMEMMTQTSGSLQADFKGLTDEIRSRGERMSQQVVMALNEDEY